MKKQIGLLLVLAISLIAVSGVLAATQPAPVPPGGQLAAYIARPEPAYQWTKVGEAQLGPCKVYGLLMTSQVWRDLPWKHSIYIFVPPKVEFPGQAVLFVTGGSHEPKVTMNAKDEQFQMGLALASQMGAPMAFLSHVPNEPLFGGLSEDAIIAYTYQKYVETGDPTWPLLFPMAKSAVKAMDAVQAFLAQDAKMKIDHFLVCGGSKRGWTTWLTAASGDKRVNAIAPMVIDTLNMAAQMPHQLALWGKYSEMIDDYTKLGIQQKMGSNRGAELLSMVDPYSYRAKLTMPKLLMHGANDPYWATDAITLYWDGLVGPKAVLYAPNSGHGLDDRIRVMSTLVAYFRSVAGGAPFPNPVWKHGETADKLTLRIESTPAPVGGRLWVASGPTKDFRQCKWTSVPMTLEGTALVGELPKPEAGTNVALFGEADYRADTRAFTLSTAPRIYPPATQ